MAAPRKTVEAPAVEAPKKKSLLNVGDTVKIVLGGRTLPGYTVLDMDDKFVKFSANIQIAPQTEVVLIPWGQIEILGVGRE